MNIKDEFPSAAQSREISDTNLEKVMFDVLRDLKLKIEQARRFGCYSISYDHGNEVVINKLTSFLKKQNYLVVPQAGNSRNCISISW